MPKRKSSQLNESNKKHKIDVAESSPPTDTTTKQKILPNQVSKKPKVDVIGTPPAAETKGKQKVHTPEAKNKEKFDPPTSDTITKQRSHHQQKLDIPWPEDELIELLTRVENSLPQNDTLSYVRRLERLDWENVALKTHSVEECQRAFSTLYKHVRKYRLLGEVVADMKNVVRSVNKRPEKPKQPWNSYLFFVEDKRQLVVQENPDMHPHLISKKLGQMFKELSVVEKERYETMAKAARDEYALKLREFYEKHPEMMQEKKKRVKGKNLEEERGPPCKPKTPFELFVTEETEKENSQVNLNTLKTCREQWNYLTDKEKFFWINWADELHAKYLEDLKEYVKSHPEYTPAKLKPIITKKERQIKDRCSGRPDKPPHGAYHLFSKMILDSGEVKNINNRDLMIYLSEKWRGCSDEEKNEYKVRVNQMWEEYHRKLEEYLMTLPPEDRDRVREEESRKKNKNDGKSTPAKTPPSKGKGKKPVLPPTSPMKYFLKVYKGNEDGITVWKNMSRKEKQEYEDKVLEEKKKYIKEYEEYLKTLSREELEKLGQSLSSNQYSSDESECDSESDASETSSSSD